MALNLIIQMMLRPALLDLNLQGQDLLVSAFCGGSQAAVLSGEGGGNTTYRL